MSFQFKLDTARARTHELDASNPVRKELFDEIKILEDRDESLIQNEIREIIARAMAQRKIERPPVITEL